MTNYLRRRVVLESPFSGDVEANIAYARLCVRDSLLRGEAPIASHLLYTQETVLDDAVPEERKLGMLCGWTWIPLCEAIVVYTDYGISRGMREGIQIAIACKKPIEYRTLHAGTQTEALAR